MNFLKDEKGINEDSFSNSSLHKVLGNYHILKNVYFVIRLTILVINVR